MQGRVRRAGRRWPTPTRSRDRQGVRALPEDPDGRLGLSDGGHPRPAAGRDRAGAGRTGAAGQGHLRAADALRHQADRAGSGWPSSGTPMRVYVPYGTDWYGYLVRRLAEKPPTAVLRAQPRVAARRCDGPTRDADVRSPATSSLFAKPESVGFAHRSSARRARRLPARGPADGPTRDADVHSPATSSLFAKPESVGFAHRSSARRARRFPLVGLRVTASRRAGPPARSPRTPPRRAACAPPPAASPASSAGRSARTRRP